MKKNKADQKTALFRAGFVGAGILIAGSTQSLAQGTFGPVIVFRTGTAGPLISSTQAVGSFSASGPSLFQFAFGFSTDEEPAPGLFLDSFTLTLGEVGGQFSVVYNTSDGTGSYWAPNAPGSIFISGDSILRQAIPFPSLEPTHAHQFAYLVTAPVPNELLGGNLNFYADLFDNQNGIDSLGWISVTPVPEPSTWVLAGTALVLFFAFKRRSK